MTFAESRESERVPLVSAEASVVAAAGVAGDHAVPSHVATCPVAAEDCVRDAKAWVCVAGVKVAGTFDNAVYEIVGNLAAFSVPLVSRLAFVVAGAAAATAAAKSLICDEVWVCEAAA